MRRTGVRIGACCSRAKHGHIWFCQSGVQLLDNGHDGACSVPHRAAPVHGGWAEGEQRLGVRGGAGRGDHSYAVDVRPLHPGPVRHQLRVARPRAAVHGDPRAVDSSAFSVHCSHGGVPGAARLRHSPEGSWDRGLGELGGRYFPRSWTSSAGHCRRGGCHGGGAVRGSRGVPVAPVETPAVPPGAARTLPRGARALLHHQLRAHAAQPVPVRRALLHDLLRHLPGQHGDRRPSGGHQRAHGVAVCSRAHLAVRAVHVGAQAGAPPGGSGEEGPRQSRGAAAQDVGGQRAVHVRGDGAALVLPPVVCGGPGGASGGAVRGRAAERGRGAALGGVRFRWLAASFFGLQILHAYELAESGCYWRHPDNFQPISITRGMGGDGTLPRLSPSSEFRPIEP
mmetsp:Transcript_13227/g.25303  ORF Transcript_13227/g.25303 Transcript_13227/m.25303 type:complete len:396 (-) Transcript_13227:211-1398(-)